MSNKSRMKPPPSIRKTVQIQVSKVGNDKCVMCGVKLELGADVVFTDDGIVAHTKCAFPEGNQ